MATKAKDITIKVINIHLFIQFIVVHFSIHWHKMLQHSKYYQKVSITYPIDNIKQNEEDIFRWLLHNKEISERKCTFLLIN